MALARSAWLSRVGARWLARQERRNRSRAEPLASDVLARVAGFFDPATLDAVRMRVEAGLGIPFMGTLRRLGLTPPDTGRLLGITYLDTIVLSDAVVADRSRMIQCLVHELVHVVQIRHLGARQFARRYLMGWVSAGRRYRDIPLERDAREIARQVLTASVPFSVEAEVARRLAG